jgi:aminoglycoside 6-adenylyltransferase
MIDAASGYEALITKFLSWARSAENIRALVVIGSRARIEDHPADQWSDLDLLVVANDPKPLWEGSDWLREIGTPWITFVEPTPGDGGFECRALFEGGLDVDFAPIAVQDVRAMAGRELPPVIADIFRRGVRVILDKDGLMEGFRDAKPAPACTLPAESEFLTLVNDFWYHAVWTAKHLRRGEMWWANSCCDMYLKNLLRQMLEWHAHAVHGEGLDTWMRGRFLEEWADPKAVAALPEVFAHYDVEDIWRALLATMKVFHDLASETAGLLKYSYPALGEERARGLVMELNAGRKNFDRN